MHHITCHIMRAIELFLADLWIRIASVWIMAAAAAINIIITSATTANVLI